MLYALLQQINPNYGFAEYIGIVLAVFYAIHLALHVGSWVCSWVYSYVQDGEATIPLWWQERIVNLLYGEEDQEPEEPRIPAREELNGWWQVDQYFRFWEFKDGEACNYSDSVKFRVQGKLEGGLISRGHRQYEDTFREGSATTVTPLLPQPPAGAVSRGTSYFNGYAPSVLAALLVSFDLQPVIAICIASTYLTLRVARKVIRTSKKISIHIKDKNAHTEEGV